MEDMRRRMTGKRKRRRGGRIQTVAAGDGEETGDLVAKAGVVGVLHDGHELDAVVS